LRINPSDPTAHFNLGLTFKAAGDRKAALEQLQQAQNLAPGNQQYHQAYEALMNAPDKAEAHASK